MSELGLVVCACVVGWLLGNGFNVLCEWHDEWYAKMHADMNAKGWYWSGRRGSADGGDWVYTGPRPAPPPAPPGYYKTRKAGT